MERLTSVIPTFSLSGPSAHQQPQINLFESSRELLQKAVNQSIPQLKPTNESTRTGDEPKEAQKLHAMKTTKHKTGRNSGHIAIRLAVFLVVLTASLGSLYYYTQKHGGFTGIQSHSVTWIDNKNAQAILNLKKKGEDVVANPDLPVLLVICPKEVGEDKTIDLGAVSASLAGKVAVVALDPYADKDFASAFSSLFIDGPLTKSAAINLAVQLLREQNQPVSKDAIDQLMNNQQFIDLVRQQENDSPIFKAVYPKFFVLSAKTFDLACGTVGIDNKDDVLAFVETGLSVISKREAARSAQAAAAQAAPTAPATPTSSTTGSTTSAATTATTATATPATAQAATTPTTPVATPATTPVAVPSATTATPSTPAATAASSAAATPAAPTDSGKTPASAPASTPTPPTPTDTPDTTSGETPD